MERKDGERGCSRKLGKFLSRCRWLEFELGAFRKVMCRKLKENVLGRNVKSTEET